MNIFKSTKAPKKIGRPAGTVKQKGVLKYLNSEQLKAFRRVLAKRPRLDWVMLELVLFLGLRVSELLDIRRKDVRTDSQEVYIRALKNGDSRTYKILHKTLWRRFLRFYNETQNDEDKIFAVPLSTIKWRFKDIAKQANLPADYSIHCLRHTCAIICAENGDTPIEIMRWLRHKDVRSTQIYFRQVLFVHDSERKTAYFYPS